MKGDIFSGGRGKTVRELLLILESARGVGDLKQSGERIGVILSQPIQWDLFLSLVLKHRVIPLVYKTLHDLKIQSIPPYVMNFLKQEYEKNALKSLVLTGEMTKLIRLFRDRGVSSLVLKGAPLAEKIYQDVTFRMSKDIDLLVPWEDLSGAEKILLAAGYEKKTTGFALTPRQSRACLNKYHHHVYLNRELKTCVELHWKMHQIDLKFSPFLINRRCIEVSGFSVPVLLDDEWVFFLMIHGSSHKWMRLHWLIDVERFFKCTKIDWDKIMELAEHSQTNLIIHQTILILDEIFQPDFPDWLIKVALRDKKAGRLAGEVIKHLFSPDEESTGISVSYWKKFFTVHGYRYRIRTGWKNKLAYLHSLIQPIERDFQFYPLPDFLYPLYYLIRPVTWLQRRIAGSR